MDITKTYIIQAPAADVWRALSDPGLIEEWGGGPAEMRAEPGADFSLWGGDIHGTVTEAEPVHRLAQDWYGGDWPRPSRVVFTLDAEGDATRLTLLQSGVPDAEAVDLDRGWDDYYLGPIKNLLESGH